MAPRSSLSEYPHRLPTFHTRPPTHPTDHRAEHVRPALERSLADLGIAYVDLYLIHFPIALRYVAFDALYPPEWVHPESLRMELDRVPLAETWAAMEALQDAGLARALGVCNMTTGLLTDLASVARQLPEVLQVEMHPRLTQERLLRYCREAGIAVTAFSPLGAGSCEGGGGAGRGLFHTATLTSLPCAGWRVQTYP